MKTSLEKISTVRFKMKIEVSSEDLPQKINQKLAQIQKNSKMDGFRRGKVPLSLIKKNYQTTVNAECIDDLINQSYQEAIKKEDVIPISAPKVDIISKMPVDKTLKYSAEFDVFPTVELKDFKEVELEPISCKPNEKDVEKQINEIQKRNPSFKESNTKAKDGDALDISYQLVIKGKPEFEKPNDLRLVIGSKTMIPGFEEKMVGLKKGDESQFELTFPKDYSHKELQNETVKFEIRVQKVESPIESKLDDEFAKKMGAESLIQFKENLTNSINSQAKNIVLSNNRKAIIDEMLKIHNFEIPESMIHQTQHQLMDEQKKQLDQNKQSTEYLKISDFKEDAIKQVKVSLIFHKIAEDYQLKNDAKRFNQKISEIAEQYGGKAQIDTVKKFYNENEDQKKSLESICMEEQIIDLILEKTNTTTKEISFEKLIEKQSATG